MELVSNCKSLEGLHGFEKDTKPPTDIMETPLMDGYDDFVPKEHFLSPCHFRMKFPPFQ